MIYPMDSGEESSKADRKGLVFNIQRFSVHDGPGIRTTVFMKGCPLTCLWCANPESQDFGPQLMTRDIKCSGCGACVQVCPQGAVRIGSNGRGIDWDLCDQCLLCAGVCRYGALLRSGDHKRMARVLDEVLRDRLFYKNSGGGVTVSGGEPLAQSDFVAALLSACKQEGLHTAVDTTGCVSWSRVEQVAPLSDLMLWDVKQMDPQLHEKATGVDNRLILENVRRASALTKIWLRIPLIAGFNDSDDNINRVIELAKEIGAPKISLLPYHEGGRSKNHRIGRPYPYSGALAPTAERVERLAKRIGDNGVDAGIGN